jgi:nucleotide-binding universal stress UspA family protein
MTDVERSRSEIGPSAAGPVVVGVDGSSESVAAARWALDEAFARGRDVEIVHCWEAPRVDDQESHAIDFRTLEAQIARSTMALDDAFATLADRIDRNKAAGCRVERRVQRGPPGPAIVTKSKHAAMVVVGRHGRSRRNDVELGSVADYILHYAGCATVPPPWSTPARDATEQQERDSR